METTQNTETNFRNEWTDKAYKVFAGRPVTDDQITTIETIKTQAAMLWDTLDKITSENADAGRLVSLAKTELEKSVMWATKAISRQ